ncbi:MAG: peptide deformylase [Clostridia bacterium]
MATRKIIIIGDELLRKKSKEQKVFDENLGTLLDDMKETMKINDGMGLAAVQVGVLKRVVIIEANNMFMELVNPVINYQEGKRYCREGCLSVVGVREWVARPTLISVSAYDRFGNPFTIVGVDDLAMVLSHEIDHLDGIVFTDKSFKENPDAVKKVKREKK